MNIKLQRVEWLSSVLDIPTAQTYDAIAKGQIPDECIVRVGRRIRINADKVMEWLQAEPAQAS